MTDISIGLVGAGQWGKNYLRNLAALGVLGAVCDSSQERLDSFAAEYPDLRLTTSVDDLAAIENIAGVVVATDTQHHFPVAQKLLSAGKSCLVEKPLTDSPQSARELCEFAESNGLTLMVGHILLYHPAVEHIKGMLDRGELGELQYISMVRAKLGTIRKYENVMWSFAPHDISVAQYLLGEAPQTVSAAGAAFVTPGIEDVTQLTLGYPGGRWASITSNWLDPERTTLIKVVGSKASAVFNDGNKEAPLTVYDSGVDWDALGSETGSAIKTRSGDTQAVQLPAGEPLKRECEEFVRCIAERAVPRSSGRQGYENVQILAAADESLRSGGAAVSFQSTAGA
jgi:predicted dehydrogenase